MKANEVPPQQIQAVLLNINISILAHLQALEFTIFDEIAKGDNDKVVELYRTHEKRMDMLKAEYKKNIEAVNGFSPDDLFQRIFKTEPAIQDENKEL